jgi:hypothetical protein
MFQRILMEHQTLRQHLNVSLVPQGHLIPRAQKNVQVQVQTVLINVQKAQKRKP